MVNDKTQPFHKSLILMIDPKCPPTEVPVIDELTEKVDYIFSTLIPDVPMRGAFITEFGASAENRIYKHNELCIMSSSLMPYFVRHHREDISEAEIKWLHKLYDILHDIDAYYTMESLKSIYYLKAYVAFSWSNEQVFIAKANLNSPHEVRKFLRGAIFEEITEEEFNREVQDNNLVDEITDLNEIELGIFYDLK